MTRTIAIFGDHKLYDGRDVLSGDAGGIHHATASLAEAFARAGHRVTVYNATPSDIEFNGVRWSSLADVKRVAADLIIANNNARLFRLVDAQGTQVIWSHNPVKFHHAAKKGNLFDIYARRPHAVFIGSYHQQTASRLLPFASRRIIEHAHTPEFVRRTAATAAPSPRAVFTSRAYRGLDWTLDVWAKLVAPRVPAAELHVFGSPAGDASIRDCERFGVVLRGRISRAELAQELMSARLMICPGHDHETYCFAAAEGTLAGLPIVSRGIGSLAERVQHDRNGYIAADPEAFAEHAVTLLTDDHDWLKKHKGALATRDLGTWDDRVAQWTDAFLR